MRLLRRLVAAWVAGLFVDVECATWPQWRGPTRDGQVSVGSAAWPDSVDAAHLRQSWRVKLGPGYPGPVVTTDRVFSAETKGKKSERVAAFDRATGKELWSVEWEGAMTVPFFAKSNGDWIRSTPAWDGTHLYVAGMRDVLVCIRGSDGTIVWRKDFPEELKTEVPAFGFVCSPLVEGDAVYVQAGAAVVRLDKLSGKVVWRAMEEKDAMNGSAFSSPILATIAGRLQLLVQTRSKIAGLDPESGEVLWSNPVEAFRGMNILTPLPYDGEHVFTSAYGGKTHGFAIGKTANGQAVSEAWSFKAQGYMTSPVLVGGQVYLLLKNQRLLCMNPKAGKENWTSSEGFGKYWSLVANKDRMLGLDERGELFLLRANVEKLEILSRRKLAEDSWAHLAVADRQVFIRELDGLAVYEWDSPKN